MSKPGTYDQITTGWKFVDNRYRLWIRYSNSDTSDASYELSARSFRTEAEATKAANALALQLKEKLRE